MIAPVCDSGAIAIESPAPVTADAVQVRQLQDPENRAGSWRSVYIETGVTEPGLAGYQGGRGLAPGGARLELEEEPAPGRYWLSLVMRDENNFVEQLAAVLTPDRIDWLIDGLVALQMRARLEGMLPMGGAR